MTGVEIPGTGKVLDYMTEGFVDGDFFGGATAFAVAGEDLADLGGDVGVVDEAGGSGAEELGTVGEDAGAAVGDEAGADDEIVVDFGWTCGAGADDVDVGSGMDPCAFENGLGGGGKGADDVGIGDRGFRAGGDGDGDGKLSRGMLGELNGAMQGATPDGDGFERTDPGDGTGVGCSLFAVAEQSKARGVGTGQGVGGYGRGGGGADGGDLTGMCDADRGSGVGVEEDDEALVGRDAFGEVFVEDADELGAEGRAGAERAGHDAEETALGERQDGAQQLHGLAAGERDHGVADDRNRDLVGEAPGNFFAVDKAHAAA